MRKFITAAFMLSAATFGYQQQATAASVGVSVDITIPSVMILYCFTGVNVNVSATDLATVAGAASGAVTTGTAPTVSITPTTGSIDATLTGLNTAGTNLSSVTLTLNDVCAYRAIGTDVDVTLPGGASFSGTLSDGGTSAITMSNPLVQVASSGFASSQSGVAASGLGTPVSIDLRATLDLSGVTSAASHTGGLITVQAVANP